VSVACAGARDSAWARLLRTRFLLPVARAFSGAPIAPASFICSIHDKASR